MKKVFSMIAVTALTCSVALPAAAISSNSGRGMNAGMSSSARGGKIAVVDMQKIVQNSPDVAADKKKLQEQFAPDIKKAQAEEKSLQALKDKYKKEHATMRSDQLKALEKQIIQKQTALMKSQQVLQQKIGQAKQKDFEEIIKNINGAVAKIAREKGYAVVLPKRIAVYTDPSQVANITSAVGTALGNPADTSVSSGADNSNGSSH